MRKLFKAESVQTAYPFKHSSKVWIDLDNSPHVPFFMPIMARLKEMGYELEVTARDCFQVCGLADLNRIAYRRIGKHYGKNKVLKVLGSLYRAWQLLPVAARAKPVLALSHGSRAMLLSAWTLNIPTVLMMDYEFTQKIPFVHPDLVITPEVVQSDGIIGNMMHTAKYPGIKEDVYVPFFKPDSSIQRELGLKEDNIIVTIRPPATEAHYHNPEAEILFTEIMRLLGALKNVQMVILPRNEAKQTAFIRQSWPALFERGQAIIPTKVVDGLNLIYHSDLVISGGGTMNREAAALGIPVYSIFRGKIGAVDRYLSRQGRLTLLTSKQDVSDKIQIKKRRNKANRPEESNAALNAIMKAIDDFMRNR